MKTITKIKCLMRAIPLLLLLSGCTSMNSEFDCPMKPGVRCESIDQVNREIDRGQIGSHSIDSLSSDKHRQSDIYEPVAPIANYKGMLTSFRREPLRYGETVQRIWVAPYEDSEGNYHPESEIFTITKPGHWIGYPVKTTADSGE
jgi:conjugal transfer pilus assembly protein TraV